MSLRLHSPLEACQNDQVNTICSILVDIFFHHLTGQEKVREKKYKDCIHLIEISAVFGIRRKSLSIIKCHFLEDLIKKP